MNAIDLAEQTQQNNEMFRVLMAQYAKPLYQKLYQKYNDHDITSRAVKAAFHELYIILQKPTGKAAIEELLLRLAMEKQQAILCQKAEGSMWGNHAVRQICPPIQAEKIIIAEQNKKTEQTRDEEKNIHLSLSQECINPTEHPSLRTACSSLDDISGVVPTGIKLYNSWENTASVAEKNEIVVPRGTKFKLVLLTVVALALLWTIAGLLMDIRIIPEMDFGYEWFNMNVAAWF